MGYVAWGAGEDWAAMPDGGTWSPQALQVMDVQGITVSSIVPMESIRKDVIATFYPPPADPELPNWREPLPQIHVPADPNRIGVWTWARQYNMKRGE